MARTGTVYQRLSGGWELMKSTPSAGYGIIRHPDGYYLAVGSGSIYQLGGSLWASLPSGYKFCSCAPIVYGYDMYFPAYCDTYGKERMRIYKMNLSTKAYTMLYDNSASSDVNSGIATTVMPQAALSTTAAIIMYTSLFYSVDLAAGTIALAGYVSDRGLTSYAGSLRKTAWCLGSDGYCYGELTEIGGSSYQYYYKVQLSPFSSTSIDEVTGHLIDAYHDGYHTADSGARLYSPTRAASWVFSKGIQRAFYVGLDGSSPIWLVQHSDGLYRCALGAENGHNGTVTSSMIISYSATTNTNFANNCGEILLGRGEGSDASNPSNMVLYTDYSSSSRRAYILRTNRSETI